MKLILKEVMFDRKKSLKQEFSWEKSKILVTQVRELNYKDMGNLMGTFVKNADERKDGGRPF